MLGDRVAGPGVEPGRQQLEVGSAVLGDNHELPIDDAVLEPGQGLKFGQPGGVVSASAGPHLYPAT
jgi:hypothetical protein